MQTVILAAGQGTRMGPLTNATPKPMLPVADRPLAAHVADVAIDAGATELIVVVGYRADAVQAYFGDEYRDTPVTYAHQDAQRGTADALRAANEFLDGQFAVLNGDNLYDGASIADLFAAGPAVAAHEVADPSEFGVLSTAGSDEPSAGDVVTDIVEKPADPATNLANAGAYVFPAEATDWLDVPESERGEYEITDVLARAIDAVDVSVVPVERWLDVGYPWDLLAANEWKIGDLERRIGGAVRGDADLQGAVVVESGATVEPGVVVEGPAIIRSGATVGPNAYVRGVTLVGPDAHVGHGVEIKNSVLRAGSAVPHVSYVGDSVLGENVNFGAGTQVANLRHDDATVRSGASGERRSTGRRKFGVVAGDGVKTGINTSLEPGVTLSSGAHTDPGERVSRDR